MEEKTTYAPVIIYTLCRDVHFRRCVESLSRCTDADKTDLFIALDYPAKDSHKPGWERLKAYLHSDSFGEVKAKFHNVIVQERKENYGPSKNFITIRDCCYSMGYDRYIVSEDDNEFSPNFLDYMNKGLNQYCNRDDIQAICGYTPLTIDSSYPHTAYSSYEYSAWGAGVWKKKFYKYNKEEVIDILKSGIKVWKLFKKEPRILYTLYRMINIGAPLYGDTCAVTRSILNNYHSIFPAKSLVRNWGNDGSGVNCYKIDDRKFVEQEVDTATTFNFDTYEIPELDTKVVRKETSLMWKQKIKFPYQMIRFYAKYGFTNNQPMPDCSQ